MRAHPILLALFMSLPAVASAQPLPPKRGAIIIEDVGFDGIDVNPSGQYMVRYRHFEGHDFASGGNADTFRHRARLGLGATYDDMVGFMVQAQDVRVWGEERNTLGDFSADGFDMHQAYGRVMPTPGLEIRVGRQEIAFENHRLIGTVAWIEQARSFDAFRVSFEHDILRLDSFYAKIAEDAAPTQNAGGEPLYARDADLLATNVHLTPLEGLDIGIIGILDTGGPNDTDRVTVGGLVTGKTPYGLSYGAEGYYQGGRSAAADLSAYMVAAKLRYTFDVATNPFLHIFGELLSGDEDPGDADQTTFNTLFHTGHKWYGEMDFFLNLPVDTQNRGLVDAGGGLGLSPTKGMLAQATVHHFRAAANQGEGVGTFGNELDVRIDYTPWPNMTVDLFYGLFAPEDLFEPAAASKLEHFVYSTADFGF